MGLGVDWSVGEYRVQCRSPKGGKLPEDRRTGRDPSRPTAETDPGAATWVSISGSGGNGP